VKDAEAALKDIRMGRITWFEAVLANGYDPNAQLAQIALFNKLVDKFEIILDCDPRNTTLRGQEQPAGTEERTPSKQGCSRQREGPAHGCTVGGGSWDDPGASVCRLKPGCARLGQHDTQYLT